MAWISDLLDLVSSTRELFRALPGPVSVAERLKAFPHKGLPLRRRATLYWNEHQIPFIDAQTDEDAALLLGMTHAHLRWAQLELYRRTVSGRLAEIAGPPAVSIDWTLRLMGLDRTVPEIERELPDDTRLWLSRFAEGINLYCSRAVQPPYELRAFHWRPEPWTVADVLRVSRIAAADVSWIHFFSYFALRGEKAFDSFWDRFRQVRYLSAAGRGLWGGTDRISQLLTSVSRMGSNSLVLSPALSRSGAALIANDPHLGVSLPNIWLVAGYRCPSYHVVGLMIPGLPFVALGRNPQIAWGGTNLHAQSSDLFDLSSIPDDDPRIRSEQQTIRVRFWRDRPVTLRRSPWGPILSDSPLFAAGRPGEKIAIRWVGDGPSHEITAMLRANRARTVEEFAEAFEEYAVSGQNFLVADRHGHIAHVIAAKVPRRASGPRPFLLDPDRHEGEWGAFWTPADFPVRTDPPQGFLASANNRPPDEYPPVGEMFPPTDRVDRIGELLLRGAPWDCATLTELQRDTFSRSSVQLRDCFLLHLRPARVAAWQGWLTELESWDGTYRRDSRGAVVFQTLLWHYIRLAYRDRYGKRLTHFLLGSELSRLFAIEDLAAADSPARGVLELAAALTTKTWKRRRRWGDLHRLRLGHFFQTIPALGKKFRFHDLPAEGSTETVQKTAHSVTPRRHSVHYGSQARHLSDLADPDANYFLLLGGQDGWLGSDTFDDQVPRWDRAELIAVPLQVEAVRSAFPTEMTLEPEKKLGG